MSTAVGGEGPIIQIGAALGCDAWAAYLQSAPWQSITLVAAGAGAGIAATVQTQFGGVMFPLFELLLPELSARTFLPRCARDPGTARFRRSHLLWHSPRASFSGQPFDVGAARHAACTLLSCPANMIDRARGDRVHPRPQSGGGFIRAHQKPTAFAMPSAC